jgi:DNA-binding MarR family transcriptional regulator
MRRLRAHRGEQPDRVDAGEGLGEGFRSVEVATDDLDSGERAGHGRVAYQGAQVDVRLLFAIQRELGETMERDGFAPLSPRYGAILAYLDEDRTRATELAQLAGLHKQVVGTLVDELESTGLVSRKPDPADRRAKLIIPTAEGVARMHRSGEIMAEIDRRYANELGTQEYAEFKRVFQRLTELRPGTTG